MGTNGRPIFFSWRAPWTGEDDQARGSRAQQAAPAKLSVFPSMLQGLRDTRQSTVCHDEITNARPSLAVCAGGYGLSELAGPGSFWLLYQRSGDDLDPRSAGKLPT